ncbi:golgin subfamily A member 6-like protein 2 [Trematomus bernacchii]|uniref:golgin subfamily A member 6-like protein 2 n=1 Tax=Trematomus bernacchii TaxID=40690 RepID=UPI00146CA06E|nr:golgin subfamily A member 6-like protein 2 [Trematomus bernacchii]
MALSTASRITDIDTLQRSVERDGKTVNEQGKDNDNENTSGQNGKTGVGEQKEVREELERVVEEEKYKRELTVVVAVESGKAVGHYARDCVAREEGASGARGRRSAQAEKTAENEIEEEEGGSQEESEEEGRSDEAGSSLNKEAVAAVAAIFVAAAAKRAADTAAADDGGDGGRKKGKADYGGACSSGANAAAVPAADVPAAMDAGKAARSGEGLVDTEADADVDVDPGADADADADADVEAKPDAGGGAVGERKGGEGAGDGGGDGGDGGQTAEEMEVSSVVSDMEEGGDYEENESDGEEVEMMGPLGGKIFGETNAVIKSRGIRRESSRLNAKRKVEKDKEVEKRRVKTSGGATKCLEKK